MLSILSAVSAHVHIWITSYIRITHVFAKPACMPMKHTKFVENMHTRASQNARA